MRRFHLHVITDGQRQAHDLHAVVDKAVRGGADVIQLRDKAAPALDLYTLGLAVRDTVRAGGAKLTINDRLDVALALGADGVHLAGKSLPVEAARPLLPPPTWVGCSVHSVEEAVSAERAGVSYVTYGHVFDSHSKPGLPPRGIEALASVVEAVQIPVLAIGGITGANIERVLATGVAGIAVIGAVMAQADPERAAYELREAMDRSAGAPKVALM